jgi:lipid-binding SYLF domain-containing protein
MKLSCRNTSLIVVGLLVGMFVVPVVAQKNSRMQDAARHASEAAETFTEIMNVREKSIPKELLDKAEAIAVFPGVVKAAFIVGGRGGQGVVSRRVKGGWSAPAFFNLAGGSFGAQIGAQKTD